MDQTFDTLSNSTYNAPFVTANGGTAAGAEAALFAGLAAGTAYLNIHTTQNMAERFAASSFPRRRWRSRSPRPTRSSSPASHRSVLQRAGASVARRSGDFLEPIARGRAMNRGTADFAKSNGRLHLLSMTGLEELRRRLGVDSGRLGLCRQPRYTV